MSYPSRRWLRHRALGRCDRRSWMHHRAPVVDCSCCNWDVHRQCSSRIPICIHVLVLKKPMVKSIWVLLQLLVLRFKPLCKLLLALLKLLVLLQKLLLLDHQLLLLLLCQSGLLRLLDLLRLKCLLLHPPDLIGLEPGLLHQQKLLGGPTPLYPFGALSRNFSPVGPHHLQALWDSRGRPVYGLPGLLQLGKAHGVNEGMSQGNSVPSVHLCGPAPCL